MILFDHCEPTRMFLIFHLNILMHVACPTCLYCRGTTVECPSSKPTVVSYCSRSLQVLPVAHCPLRTAEVGSGAKHVNKLRIVEKYDRTTTSCGRVAPCYVWLCCQPIWGQLPGWRGSASFQLGNSGRVKGLGIHVSNLAFIQAESECFAFLLSHHGAFIYSTVNLHIMHGETWPRQVRLPIGRQATGQELSDLEIIWAIRDHLKPVLLVYSSIKAWKLWELRAIQAT